MHSLIADYGTTAATYLLSGLAMAAAWAFFDRMKEGRLKRYIGQAGGAARTAVLFVWQTYVDELRKGKADDGKLSDEEKAKAKAKAIAAMKSLIGRKGLSILGKAFELDEWLGVQVEAALQDEKAFSPKK